MLNDEIKNAIDLVEYRSALFEVMKYSFKQKQKEQMSSGQIEILDKIKMHLDEARQDLYSLIENQKCEYHYYGA